MIHKAKYPKIKIIPKSTLLKKLPQKHHLKLEFIGDDALELLELRKLGLFSKKAFRKIKGLDLKCCYGYIENKHISILANHMNKSLRKLNHLSLAVEPKWSMPQLNAKPLLKSIKHTFVCLSSLKLAFRRDFRSLGSELLSFERLFARVRTTLKHLDIDLSINSGVENSYSEDLGMMVMNRLHKLETLCLNFNSTNTNTRIARMLISGACTHLNRLKSLKMNLERGIFVQGDWNSYPKHNLTSNLQYFGLNINNCQGLRYNNLWTLQNDIIIECPDLKELFFSMKDYKKLSSGFDSNFEMGFLKRLNLKKFRFLYSNELENTWNAYQETKILELEQAVKMEEEVEMVKQRARGEDEIQCYYSTLVEEKQAPTRLDYWGGENEYLENDAENHFFENEKHEEEEQDHLQQMAQEYGEAVFGEQFWINREECYAYGIDPDGNDWFELEWEREEEIIRDFQRNNGNIV